MPDSDALTNLREIILALQPTGENGFEGLVAVCLSNLSHLDFRLAKAGSQFGRDATSAPDRFAIAIETKRYRDNPRLEELAGKAAVAAHALGGLVDAWVLGCASSVAESTVIHLAAILEQQGIALVVLDWAMPQPQLAVLLAAEPRITEDWFRGHFPDRDCGPLVTILNTVRDQLGFGHALQRLREQVSAATVGLDALRAEDTGWNAGAVGQSGQVSRNVQSIHCGRQSVGASTAPAHASLSVSQWV